MNAWVLNRNRKVIATKYLKEELAVPSGWPEDTLPDIYQRKMQELLDDTVHAGPCAEDQALQKTGLGGLY